jgi:dihydroflavonol-4-reductase
VVVNPSYVLGPALNRSLPGETSTRLIGNYMQGRLPAIVDSYSNIVDVEDVALGHLLAAAKGRPGERYILPLLVLPTEVSHAAAMVQRLGMPVAMLEGIRLMAPDWRYSSAKAKRELGYGPRGARETLERTVAWYMELIEDDRLAATRRNSLDWASAWLRLAGRLGLLGALRTVGGLTGRKVVIG